MYIYKEDYISQKDLNLKKQTVGFIKELGYPGCVIPQDEVSQKCLKRLIETHLLMDAHTKEERKVIFLRVLDVHGPSLVNYIIL